MSSSIPLHTEKNSTKSDAAVWSSSLTMVAAVSLVHSIQIFISAITLLFSLAYSIPVLLIARFRNVNNIFTVNLCIASICCNVYWLLFLVVDEFSPEYLLPNNHCIAFNYFEMMCTVQVPFAVIAVAVSRLCSIVYHTKRFFKRKAWVILCISIQWTLGVLFALPRLPFGDWVRTSSRSLVCLELVSV